ncbi:MAG: PAS domain-containing protein [Anaerolineae bacterium]|nr:PAS domain-containing protein [Anaerolineae bacterium]
MSVSQNLRSQLEEELAAARARIAQLESLVAEYQGRIAALEQEVHLFDTFMANVPDQVYFKDTESRFIKVSLSQARRFGLEHPDQTLGKTDFDFFTEEHARPAYEDEQTVMRTGQPLIREEKETFPDGREAWVLTVKMPLRDREGRIVGTFGISKDITERKLAEEALRRAYAEIEQRIAERTAELEREVAERERLQQEVIEAQRQALRELSTPIIPVLEGIIVMPLIGSIDTLRARDITRSLLAGIREYRARVVILDITGVPLVDSGVAAHLNKTIQAARLKGAQTIVTGISESVAETIVDMGIDWSGIRTLSDLQSGLLVALNMLGMGLVRREAQGMRRP